MKSLSTPPDVPREDQGRPRVSIEKFLDGLTDERKEILFQYLQFDGGNAVGPLALRNRYGEVFDALAYGVQELIEAYDSNYDAIRYILLTKMEGDFRTSGSFPAEAFRESVQEVIDPHAKTMFLGSPSSQKTG